MLQFGSKHVCIKDVHIFKYCHEMTLFLLWIGTYCISCVVQQTSGVKDLSSLVRCDDSSLAAIRHVQSIIPLVRPRPNIRSHSVLFKLTSISILRGERYSNRDWFLFTRGFVAHSVVWERFGSFVLGENIGLRVRISCYLTLHHAYCFARIVLHVQPLRSVWDVYIFFCYQRK